MPWGKVAQTEVSKEKVKYEEDVTQAGVSVREITGEAQQEPSIFVSLVMAMISWALFYEYGISFLNYLMTSVYKNHVGKYFGTYKAIQLEGFSLLPFLL